MTECVYADLQSIIIGTQKTFNVPAFLALTNAI